MSIRGPLFTPESVQREIRRRGYRCAVFYDGHHYDLVRSHCADGSETAAYRRNLEKNPHGHVGTYDITIRLDWLAEDMAAFRQEAA